MLPNGINNLRHYFTSIDQAFSCVKKQRFKPYQFSNSCLPVMEAKKISELLSRLQNKLETKSDNQTSAYLTRSILLIEIVAAAERIEEELDIEIARICALGNQTASIEDSHLMKSICARASWLSQARRQVISLHQDLNSMLLSMPDKPHTLPSSCHFQFDLLARKSNETSFVLNSFSKAIEASIASLSELGINLLKNREFERLSEICEINMRLTHFTNEISIAEEQLNQSLPPSSIK